MTEYQHQQVMMVLRAIGLGIVGVAITVGSFVAGQIAVFLGSSQDDARLATLCTAAFGGVFTIVSLALILITPREKYSVARPESSSSPSRSS